MSAFCIWPNGHEVIGSVVLQKGIPQIDRSRGHAGGVVWFFAYSQNGAPLGAMAHRYIERSLTIMAYLMCTGGEPQGCITAAVDVNAGSVCLTLVLLAIRCSTLRVPLSVPVV